MPTFFQRPENALKRAKEFIDVGKQHRALDALYDVIKSKKHRTWQSTHEPIMETYLTLCVELKKSHIAKEGLYQYKNICQQVNIKSLEDVVRRYLALAEEKTETARQQSQQAVIDVDDLDVLQTPENVLLSAVSGEDTQDRTDRAILTPWVKFLWESYRQCLDLLRNNSTVEKLYQDIAKKAFQFCLNYTRKTEFRKLCDNLRTHLGHIHKHQHQQRAINLNNPESQAMHLETRLVQLDSAIQMELWQEAFKAVEDIHGLIALSKKPPKPSVMANYYSKLGLVFWKSGNIMFHACAWHRLYHLSKEQRKNLSTEELAKLSARVLCATLAVPIAPHQDNLLQDDNAAEKKKRLATLLGLQSTPTRASLLKDLVRYNLMQHVYPELQGLHHSLEVEFHPLHLYSSVSEALAFISKKEELMEYVPALENTVITRLLTQVSQVYQTISMDRFMALAPFASKFRLERVIVNTARTLRLQVRLSHQDGSLSFGRDLTSGSRLEEAAEGPVLQRMPGEQVRTQLVNIAQALNKAVSIIAPSDVETQREALRSVIVQSYQMTAKREHQRILQRRQIIEERKEELENLTVQREREEMEVQEEERRRQYDTEMARLEREAREREEQRRQDEHREIQKKVAKDRIDQIKNTSMGAKAFQGLSEEAIADMDVDDILAKQVEQLEKEKRELQDKLKAQEKKVDYFERAKRLEEIPILKKSFENLQEQDIEFWKQQEAERVELLKKEREVALQHRDRLLRMVPDKEQFVSRLRDARLSVYKDRLDDFEKNYSEEKKKRLEDRKTRRREERRLKYEQEKQEAEQRKQDEELKKQREEAEREEQERVEREAEAYKERIRKLEEIEERKRQREREIEERQKREQGGETRSPRPDPERRETDDWRGGSSQDRPSGEGSVAWRPQRQEGGWRQRERARADSWKRPDSHDDPDIPPEIQDHDKDVARPSNDPPKPDRWKAGPPAHDERDGWRDRGPRDDAWRDRQHDEGPRGRDDGPRGRDDGPRGRDDGPRGRDDGPRGRDEGAWRGGGRAPPREEGGGWRDRGPPREEPNAWRDRRGGDGWRDEGSRWRDDDRRGPRDDRRGPRDDDRRGPRDDDRRGPRDDDRRGPRDDDRRGPRDDDRRGPRDDDRRGPRDDDRIGPRDNEHRSPRDDDRRGPRDDDRRGPRDDEHRSPRDDDRRGPRDDDRRGPRDDDRRGPRDDRRGPRDDDRRAWGSRDDRGPRDGRGFRDDRGPRDRGFRDERGARDDEDGGGWRREAPTRSDMDGRWRRADAKPMSAKPREEERRPPTDRSQDDDGWTTVRH